MTTDNNSLYFVAEQQLHQFSSVIKSHESDLCGIIDKLLDIFSTSFKTTPNNVDLQVVPKDDSISALIPVNGKLINKIVLTLSTLCKEMKTLCDECQQNLIPPLLLYGDKGIGNYEINDGESALLFSRIIDTLHKVHCFIRRNLKLVENVLLQLSALYPMNSHLCLLSVCEAHFQVVFEQLAGLLNSIITLDEVILNNKYLKSHWGIYKKLLRNAYSSPEHFAIDKNAFHPLMKMMNDIDIVVQGNLFKWFIKELYVKLEGNVTKNSAFREEMLCVIVGWSGQIEQSVSEPWTMDYQPVIIGFIGLVILYISLYNHHEKKLFRIIFSIIKKVPLISLIGAIVWNGEQYIEKSFSEFVKYFDRKLVESIQSCRLACLNQKVAGIAKDLALFYEQIENWSIKLKEASLKPVSQLLKEDYIHRISLLFQGMFLAISAKYSTENILNFYSAFGKPMGKSCALKICHLIEGIKTIQTVYLSFSVFIAELLPDVLCFISYQITALIYSSKNVINSLHHINEQKLDILLAMALSEQNLSERCSQSRVLVTRIALSIANQAEAFKAEDFSTLLVLIKRLDIASQLESKMLSSTLCHFVYHHKILFNTYLDDYAASVTALHRIHFMLLAVDDCEFILSKAVHLNEKNALVYQFREEFTEVLKAHVLNKLCKGIETELRVSCHSHLQLEERNPFLWHVDYSPFMHVSPLSVLGEVISIKDYVEQYLESTFYTLTVISPYNWRTYEDMKNLASRKYGLMTALSLLPSQTLDQGIDVIYIMRNIDEFVKKIYYNLNQQFFLNFKSGSKQVLVLTIRHVANSIRTHGAGFINTTVNYAYKFLKQKFKLLSQMLYNEQIKSRLLKNKQFWKEAKISQPFFPYDRAEKFSRSIRKLGISKEGHSLLDQFRILITEIGNCMGYIRLLQSGSCHCSSNSAMYIPNILEIPKFENYFADITSDETKKAAVNLDKILENIMKDFQDNRDFLKMLVDVFKNISNDKKNAHLKNFHMIMPPLTITYTEYILVAKENIRKGSSTEATFTDDGFAVGMAYVMQVLNQSSSFDALRWWHGVRRYFVDLKEKVEKQRNCSESGDKKLQQTLTLTLSCIQQQHEEFELLFLGVSSARVFYQT